MEGDTADALLASVGFEVVTEAGCPVFYKTPMPRRRRLYKKDEVTAFLGTEQEAGRLLEVRADMFNFGKRKKGGGRRAGGDNERGAGGAGGGGGGGEPLSCVDTAVKQLTRDPNIDVNHKRLLSQVATSLDSWVAEVPPEMSDTEFQKFKQQLHESPDLDAWLAVVQGDRGVAQLLANEFTDDVLAEIATVDWRAKSSST